jgi:outer membrane protein assembly factor BamB
MNRFFSLSLMLALFSTHLLPAADWPMFRGPSLDGVSPEDSAPTTWSSKENIRWKAPLPRPGNGSPIVSKGRVFVTSVEDEDGKQRSLYCFDEAEGKELWVKTVDFAKKMPTHKTNPYAGTTPAADGEHVVVWHASAGLYCYDFAGKELWSKDLGEFKHMWGYGTSPIIHRGRVILPTGPGEKCFVAAFELETGKQIWRTDEPQEGNGERNAKGNYMGTWSSPVIAKVEGQDQILLTQSTRLVAYDPADGKILWYCEGVSHNKGDLSYSSPVIAGDICFVTGGFNGPAMAVRLGGTGDVTETHRLWRTEQQPQSIGSPVAVEGNIYRPNAGPGTLQCIDPADGKTLWQDRAGGSQWASIVQAGGLLYATDQNGGTTVFKPNPEMFEQVAKNNLADGCNATPAIANGRIFIRTDKNLWCIGE